MVFKCKRCGKCCMKAREHGLWIDGLTWEEKQELIAKRAELPASEGCHMLFFKDGIAHCLMYNNKPEACSMYPSSGKTCLNGNIRTAD